MYLQSNFRARPLLTPFYLPVYFLFCTTYRNHSLKFSHGHVLAFFIFNCPPLPNLVLLLNSKLYTNGKTYHRIFHTWLFPHNFCFLNWPLLLLVDVDQSFPLKLFYCAKCHKYILIFYQCILKFFLVFTLINDASINILTCLLVHICNDFSGIYT